jgi:hypothetical protein
MSQIGMMARPSRESRQMRWSYMGIWTAILATIPTAGRGRALVRHGVDSLRIHRIWCRSLALKILAWRFSNTGALRGHRKGEDHASTYSAKRSQKGSPNVLVKTAPVRLIIRHPTLLMTHRRRCGMALRGCWLSSFRTARLDMTSSFVIVRSAEEVCQAKRLDSP